MNEVTQKIKHKLTTFSSIILTKWNSFWFERNLLFSASILRLAVGSAVLLSLERFAFHRNYEKFLVSKIPSHYDPKGIMMLFPEYPPDPLFFTIIKWVAIVTTISWMLGLFTKFSQWASLISNLFLISLMYCWQTGWSHGYNPVYTAQLALAFAPTGHYFSLDKLLFTKNRKRNVPSNNGWAVYLSLILTAMVFLNAGMYKIIRTMNLDWVFSDNLRIYIAEQHLINFNKEIPTYLEWVINSEWAYKGLALLNIFSQLSPALAIIFIRKPWLRLGIAILFIIEVLGLKYVMGLDNYHWYPLALIFIDWEWALNKVRRITSININMSKKQKKRITIPLVTFFIFYFLLIADSTRIIERTIKPYPLGQYHMFSAIKAKKPYSKHLAVGNKINYMKIAHSQMDFSQKEEIEKYLNNYVADYIYNRNIMVDSSIIRKSFTQAIDWIEKKQYSTEALQINWIRQITYIPAYPEKADLLTRSEGLIARLDTSGSLQAIIAIPDKRWAKESFLELSILGLENWKITQVMTLHELLEEKQLEYWKVKNNKLYYKVKEKGLHLFKITATNKFSDKKLIFYTGEIQAKP